MERFRLGWLPGENGKDCYHRDRGAWGLPPETNARGRKKSLWIPAGLVVPALTEDGAVRRLRIRRTDEARERFGAEMKYVVVPGSSMRPLLLRPEARAFVVVEAELDAMACVAAALDAGLDVGAFAAGTNMGRPDAAAHAVLRRALCILVALDFDQPDEKGQRAGAKGMPFWAEPTHGPPLAGPQGQRPRGRIPGRLESGGLDTHRAAPFSRLRLCRRHQHPLPVAPAPEKSRPVRPWALDGWTTRGAGRKKATAAGAWGGVEWLTHPIGPRDSLQVLARAGLEARPPVTATTDLRAGAMAPARSGPAHGLAAALRPVGLASAVRRCKRLIKGGTMQEHNDRERGTARVYKTQLDAVAYLKDAGYKCSKSQFNRDVKARKVPGPRKAGSMRPPCWAMPMPI